MDLRYAGISSYIDIFIDNHTVPFSLSFMRFLTVAFLLVGIFQSNAQQSVSFDFFKLYDINKHLSDAGIRSEYWNDGILTLGLCTDSSNSRRGLTLTFIDTSGNLVWSKKHYADSASFIQGNDIVILNNRTIYIMGIVYRDSINDYDTFLAKFNSSGDLIMMNSLIEPGVDFPRHAITISTDSILGIGLSAAKWGDTYVRTTLWSMDTLGNVSRHFTDSLNLKYAEKICYHKNHYYVAGERRTSDSSDFNLKVFVDMYDSNFNFVRTYDYSATFNEFFVDIFEMKDSLVLAREVTELNKLQTSWIENLKFSIIGGKDKVDSYGYYRLDHYWSEAMMLNDSAFIMLYSNAYGTSAVNFNETLDSLNKVKIQWPLSSIVRGSSLLPNACLIGTGYTTGPRSVDHIIYKTKSLYNYLNLSYPEFRAYSQDDYGVYPNPFKDVIFIKGHSQRFPTVSIYNSEGKLMVYRTACPADGLNLSGLPTGIYNLVLGEGNRTYSIKLIKQE